MDMVRKRVGRESTFFSLLRASALLSVAVVGYGVGAAINDMLLEVCAAVVAAYAAANIIYDLYKLYKTRRIK